MAESFSLLSAMERFIRNEDDSWVMRMRLVYNGVELTSTAGVPLSHIAIANGLPEPDEVSLTEFVEALGRLGYTSVSIRIVVKPGRRVKALKPIPN